MGVSQVYLDILFGARGEIGSKLCAFFVDGPWMRIWIRGKYLGAFWKRNFFLQETSMYTPVPKPCRVFDANTVCHGYRAFIWVPNNYKKAISKHLTKGLPKYWPQVPQISPKGPKFLVENFSHTTLKWCVFMIFFDLLAKKGTLFIESGDKMGKRAH